MPTTTTKKPKKKSASGSNRDERKKNLANLLAQAKQALDITTTNKGKNPTLSDPNKTPAILFGGKAPSAVKGGLGDQPYSFFKAIGLSLGWIDASEAKEEVNAHNRLKSMYVNLGFRPTHNRHTMLVPFATEYIPQINSAGESFVKELRQKTTCYSSKSIDWDEVSAARKAMSIAMGNKTLGTLPETGAGALMGFPTLGELIELQRTREVFVSVGARQIAMPPNGMINYPKQTGGTTAYWINEGQDFTLSDFSTGDLTLAAKKLGLLTRFNNELLRFNTISAETVARLDMAEVGAREMDLSQLEGLGGARIKGITKYETTNAWVQGEDKLILHRAKTQGASYDTFQPEDVQLMVGKLPDVVESGTAWVMRKQMYTAIANRRADAVTAGDQQGLFVFSPGRKASEDFAKDWDGVPIVRSSQVSKTRPAPGSTTASTNSYILHGYFPDWIIARSGVMELVMNPWGEADFIADRTLLRAIQHVDAGARHAASFVLCDNLIVA